MTTDSNHSNSRTPSEAQIEHLLRYLQPTPSPRFYQMLLKAPWHRKPFPSRLLKLEVAFLLIGCLLVASFLISPPLRALARDWIMYFLPNRQDQQLISLSDLSPQELFQVASSKNFPDSIAQVSRQAGFEVMQPAELLPGMTFIGARYEEASQTVVLLFQGAGYNLFLSQRTFDAGKEYFSIGASATVEAVRIGNLQGEYVQGGWVTLSNLSTSEPDASMNLKVQWDAGLPQHTLRWQSGNFSLQLRSTGNASPLKSDLIALARSTH